MGHRHPLPPSWNMPPFASQCGASSDCLFFLRLLFGGRPPCKKFMFPGSSALLTGHTLPGWQSPWQFPPAIFILMNPTSEHTSPLPWLDQICSSFGPLNSLRFHLWETSYDLRNLLGLSSRLPLGLHCTSPALYLHGITPACWPVVHLLLNCKFLLYRVQHSAWHSKHSNTYLLKEWLINVLHSLVSMT